MHPVAAVDPGGELISSPTEGIADDAWQRSGPVLPLRMMMRRQLRRELSALKEVLEAE